MDAEAVNNITLGAVMAVAAILIAILTILDKFEARAVRKRTKEREDKNDITENALGEGGLKTQLAVLASTLDRVEQSLNRALNGMDCRLEDQRKKLEEHGESIVRVEQLAKSAHKRLDDHGVGKPPNGGEQ